MVIRSAIGRGLACLAIALLMGCALAEAAGAGETAPTETEQAPRWIIHAPQVPPDGMAYDRWKGIRYVQDTAFDVRLDWYLYTRGTREPLTSEQLAEKHYVLETERPMCRYEIVSVQAEPVGGEMKLRSGGYVDVTVTTRMTSNEFNYSFDTDAEDGYPGMFGMNTGDIVGGMTFSDPLLYPFDLYTGVSLLNFLSNDEADHLSNGQATDSGFVESHVAWNGRTYRLLARRDERNASGGSFEYDVKGGRCTVRAFPATEEVYTFRLPADYDGLALACPRSVDCIRPEEEKRKETTRDVYADILTYQDGSPVDQADFWYIRVSDLIRQFENQ